MSLTGWRLAVVPRFCNLRMGGVRQQDILSPNSVSDSPKEVVSRRKPNTGYDVGAFIVASMSEDLFSLREYIEPFSASIHASDRFKGSPSCPCSPHHFRDVSVLFFRNASGNCQGAARVPTILYVTAPVIVTTIPHLRRRTRCMNDRLSRTTWRSRCTS